MAKSILLLCFTFILTLCSAQNLNNFRVVTWNTAGARWDFVRVIMNSGIDILAIQEAGSIRTISRQLQPANPLLPFHLADFPMSASAVGVTEYVWNNGAGAYYLYYYDNSGHASVKQNMAIVTRTRAAEIILIPSEIRQNLPNAQAVINQAAGRAFVNRPALGVRFGNSVFFGMHLEPNRARNEATTLITSIRDYMERRSNPNLSWLAMGDFNRTPDQLALPAASNGKVLVKVRSGQNTRVTGELDYGIAGGAIGVVPNFTPQLVQFPGNPSDHTPVSAPMTTSDCYEVGQALYDEKDYNNAIAWMKEAYKKYEADEHKDALLFNNTDIMEYIGHSYYFLGDTKSGLQWTYKVLEIDPGHPRALNNIPKFKNSSAIDELQMKKPNRRNSFERDRKNYEALCRGEMDIGADISKRLKCWYASDKHPFSKYAPFKVEQLYITPNIYIFHEVLFDNEIEVIKSVAKSRRVTVHKSRKGEIFLAPTYRISTSSWLKDEVHEIVARVSRRVQQMTGLDLDTAEDLQVVNYGIGGHYDSHYDFTMKNEKNYPDSMGNRLATVLFYMSEVAQGGATVFTELGLSVFPEKGSAAFWMNLHPSGEGDMATKHAACPVLNGSKWVCTKWIHQCGQELIKPCTLEYQKEGFLRKLPRPVKKSFR